MSECLNCGCESDLSVCVLLSTKGQKKRKQKSSHALQLCRECIQRRPTSKQNRVRTALLRALQEAYPYVNK
jgi:hypothetical protein